MPRLHLSLQHRSGETMLEPTGGNVVVLIDRDPAEASWGRSGIALDPGQHDVAVHVRWFGMRWGRAESQIVLTQGEDVTLEYLTPFFIWQKRRLTKRS